MRTLRLISVSKAIKYMVVYCFLSIYSITIFYFAKEEPNCNFTPEIPEAHMPVKFPFSKGTGQKFSQPAGTGIDLGFFELKDLSKPSPGEDVFPLVISAETKDDSHKQITQAVLEKKDNEELFQVRVIRQLLWVDGVRYELREIYGIGSSVMEEISNNETGGSCVICMTEPKDTAVLPCRHMVRVLISFLYCMEVLEVLLFLFWSSSFAYI